MNLLSDELQSTEPSKIGDEPPRIRLLSDIVNQTGETLEQYNERMARVAPEEKAPLGTRFSFGLADGLRQLMYTPEGIQIMYGQGKMSLGGMLGDENMVERGRSLIQSANSEIDQQELNAEAGYKYLSPKDMESFGYNLGGGAANYGVMLALSYATGGVASAAGVPAKVAAGIATTTGLGANFAMEATGSTQEGIQKYKEKTGDVELKNITPEWATTEVTSNTLYAIGSTILEKKMGFGEQQKLFKMPMLESSKRILLTMASEGGTEFTQSLLKIGIDLTAGKLNWYELPDEIKQALMEGSVGAVLGGAAGTASAINHRATAKNALRNYIRGTVPEKDVENVVNAVYDSANDSLQNIIAKELVMSEQLRNKHGELYDSFKNAISQAMIDSGAFTDMTEDQFAQYVSENAKIQADNALAEANKRGVTIDDVLSAKEVRYEDGEIRLSDLSEETKSRREQFTLKQEMDRLDAQYPAYEGETIDIGGVQKTVYNSSGERIAKSAEALQNFYNWFGDSKVVDEQGRPLVVYHGTSSDFSVFKENRPIFTSNNLDVASEYGSYGAMPLYGVMKNPFVVDAYGQTFGEIYNAEGMKKAYKDLTEDDYKKLADTFFDGDTKEAKEWFPKEGEGFVNLAKSYGEKPRSTNEWAEYAKSKGYDGVIIKDVIDSVDISNVRSTDYVFFKSNQIKSTYNRGTYSLTDNNIYNQDEYEVKKVDKDQNLSEFRNKNEEYNKKAKDYFGTTYRMAEAGYILTDGELLDFSGKKFGGPAGQRTMDHRQVNEIDVSMEDFINSGNIRFMPEGDKILMSNYPTQKQFDVIRRVVGLSRGTFTVELMSDAQKWGMNRNDFYGEYEYGTPFTKIKRDIDAFYKGAGVRPEMAFYQSAYHGSPNKELEGGKFSLKYAGKTTGNVHGYGVYAVVSKPSAEYWAGKDGQVFELNVPEDFDLIDEQKRFNEQPEKVQWAILAALEKIDGFGLLSKAIEEDSYGGDIYVALGKDVYADKHRGIEGGSTEIMRAASEFLDKIGIKGITYNYADEKNFVIFNPDDVKVIQKFYQEQKGGAKKVYRGEYNAAKKAIKLFKNADFSTIPHEFAHYWLDNMWDYYNSGLASEQYKAQMDAVWKFLGVDPTSRLTLFARGKAHEKFASAYEKFLYNGKVPNALVAGAFNAYNDWLKRVYKDMNDIKATYRGKEFSFEMTPEIINFFNSMTSGELMTPQDMANLEAETTVASVQKADDETVKEAKEFIKEMPVPEAKPTEVKPVETTGEKRESRYYNRMKDALGGGEGVVEYTVADIEEQRAKAKEMWKNNPTKAQNILNGTEQAEDILRSALYTEQQRIALENGDRATFEESVRKQSAEATRMGQELSAMRGVVEDITMPAYWMRLAENEAQKQLAKKMTNAFDKVADKSSLQQLTASLDEDIGALYNRVKSLETNKEKAQALKDGINELKKKYKGLEQQDMVFAQTGYEDLSYEYVDKKAKEAIGIYMSDSMVDEIIQKSKDLDKLSEQVDDFGLPSSAFFAKKSELESTINRHTPSSQLKVALSTIGRSNMLTAPATSVLNITTNAQNYATQLALRNIMNKVTGHTNDNIVDTEILKAYRKKLWDVFWNTGYDISMMNSLTDTRLYKGENVTHSEGDGVIRAIGRWAEKWIFSRLISSPDVYFKSIKAFTEFAGNEATEVAYKEGLSGEKAKARAKDVFLDAVQVEPQTETGKNVRYKAQQDALVVTFQQDTELSKKLLDLRSWINKSTGDIGIGDILSPFVKTPANILSMSFDATIGPFASPRNLIQAYNDIRRGAFNTVAVQQAVRQTTVSVLSYTAMALLIAALVDDDDYIPDYSQLTQSERNAVREAGGSFGSVRIGGVYVSTDFFGPFEMPLVTILNTRRHKSIVKGLSTSAMHQFLNAPVLKDFTESAESLKKVGEGQIGILEASYDGITDAVISRAVPNLISSVAKATDEYERETNKSAINKLKAKIPFLRQTLSEKVSKSTGQPVKAQPFALQMLLGSRGRVQSTNPVAKELKRLSEVGQGASLSDITRYGDLKKLTDNQKNMINKEFAREYAKLVGILIRSPEYKRKTDEDKKRAINKIREDITSKIKQKYKKYIKK